MARQTVTLTLFKDVSNCFFPITFAQKGSRRQLINCAEGIAHRHRLRRKKTTRFHTLSPGLPRDTHTHTSTDRGYISMTIKTPEDDGVGGRHVKKAALL